MKHYYLVGELINKNINNSFNKFVRCLKYFMNYGKVIEKRKAH